MPKRLFLSVVAFLATALGLAAGESSKSSVELAIAAEARGDYRAARQLYESATRDNPKNAEAWAALGEHLRFYVHDSDAARDAFKKAIAAEDRDARASAFAWRGLGELEAKSGRDDDAIACFKKSLEALPLADTHRSLCHLYCKQRKFSDAAEHAGAAVKLNPDDPIARLLYAAQLHRAGERDAGRKQFEAALAAGGLPLDAEPTGPVHCCVIYNAAGYLGVAGDSARALRMLQRFFDTPNHRHLTREEVENDDDFAALKNSDSFKQILAKAYPEPQPTIPSAK